MKSKREKVTFWGLLVFNPLLLLFFANTSMSKDINMKPLAQIQTPSHRGPASSEMAVKAFIPSREISWNTPMAFDKELLQSFQDENAVVPDQQPENQ